MSKTDERVIHKFWHCSDERRHVCGHRGALLAGADTWENAEHALLDPKTPQQKKYIRICSACLSEMLAPARDEESVAAI